MLAAITPAELQSCVSDVQILSGFLNRFLLVAVKRQRFLPIPRPIPDALIDEHAEAIRQAIEFGRGQTRRIEMDDEAEAVYANAYTTWLSVDRPGILSAACSRAEAHTLRLSAIYALLDCSPTIRRQHVAAALAFWRYCEASASQIFHEADWTGDADLLLSEIRDRGEMDRTQIHGFHRHKSAEDVDRMLAWLTTLGEIDVEKASSNGRPREIARAKRSATSDAVADEWDTWRP